MSRADRFNGAASVLSLAWRNLLRNRRRSLMTLVAMVLGLVAVLLFGGYIRDIGYALRSDFVRQSGHLQVQRLNYFRYGSGNPTAYGIADYQRLLKRIEQDPELGPAIAVVTPILQFGGIAGNFAAGVSRTVYINGSIARDQARMFAWNEYGLRRLPRPPVPASEGADDAIIGTGVARVLQLCAALKVVDCDPPPPLATAVAENAGAAGLPSDIAALSDLAAPAPERRKEATSAAPRIELLATGPRGAPNVSAVSVKRAEQQGVKELDDVYVGLELAQAQRLVYGAGRPQVTAIVVLLKHTATMASARQRLGVLISGPAAGGEALEIVDYETLNPFYGQTLGMFAAIFGFVSVLIGAIVLFTVSNTMSMAVVERTVEIGTLRAIGHRRSSIRRLFICEGIVLACIGAVVGTACALLLAAGINRLGLTWVPPARIEHVPLAVSLLGETVLMLTAAVALVVVGALSATLPASRAARMNIVDALRHV